VQTHSTPLSFGFVPALVGVHQNLPLRVPFEASNLVPELDTSSPLAMARLVLCCHRVVPLEDATLRRTHHDRPTLAKPLPRLFGDGLPADQFPYVVRLMYSRVARLLTRLTGKQPIIVFAGLHNLHRLT